MQYPLIKKLETYYKAYEIHIEKDDNSISEVLFYMRLQIDNQHFKVLIEDEYHDFSKQASLMNFYLILQALALYQDSSDVLNWSGQIGVSAQDYLSYYQSLQHICKAVESLIGTIDDYIYDFEFQHRTDFVHQLKKPL